jgi:hypothetical protein
MVRSTAGIPRSDEGSHKNRRERASVRPPENFAAGHGGHVGEIAATPDPDCGTRMLFPL